MVTRALVDCLKNLAYCFEIIEYGILGKGPNFSERLTDQTLTDQIREMLVLSSLYEKIGTHPWKDWTLSYAQILGLLLIFFIYYTYWFIFVMNLLLCSV